MFAAHDDHLSIGHFSEFQILRLIDQLSWEQVLNFLIVDLQVLHTELNLSSFSLNLSIDCLEDVTDCSWNYTIHALDL